MTAAQLDTAADRHIAPFAAGVVLPIAGVVALLHCAASVFGGYWFDEVYMLAIGRYHLDWGSADQPPIAPALAALMDAIAPGSLVALRRQRSLQIPHPETGQPVPMLHNNDLRIRVRQDPAQLRAFAIKTRPDLHRVAGVALMMYGLWLLFRRDELRDFRFIGVTFVVLYVLFVATAGRPYYLAGLYAPLVAAGALGMEGRRESDPTRRRWLVWPAYLLSAALAVGALILSASIVRSDVGEQIARRTADAYHALPADQREQTVVLSDSYIIAAYIDGYSKRYHLPEAYSTNRSYGYFPPPPAGRDTVLFVGADADQLRPYFTDVRTVGDIGDDLHAHLLTGQRQSWQQMWPQLRTLTVS